MRDFQLPGRSAAMAMNGMAATHNPHATRVAIEVLRSGGTAIDAAVAAAAVLAVVEPQQTGIGGDCFVLFTNNATGEVIGYNGSGRTPHALPTSGLAPEGATQIEDSSPHSVTVPGAIDAWTRLVADHGRKEIAELLAPAISFARNGFPVHPRVARDWIAEAARLRRDPNAVRVFLPRGRPMRAGEVFRNPGLAEALSLIAAKGRDGFYKGPVAKEIVDYLRSLGGYHTEEDFAIAEGEYVTPVCSTYRGIEVCQIPPNNQGITALLMLNILEGYGLSALEPLGAERLHLEVEAGRLAYRDRDAFVCDTRHAPFPLEEILSKDYAARLREEISPQRVATHLPPPLMRKSDTVYLTVVDRDRNCVSFINSVYSGFGSTRVTPTYGITLQNRGMGFSLDPNHPNAVGPGKRPLHTIMPGMALKNGRPWLVYGVMGGDYQPFGHTHVLTGVTDLGLDPQEAIDQPRIFHSMGKTVVEHSVPQKTIELLRKMGHSIVEATEPHGGGQMIMIDWDEGVLIGGSDGRMDGCALGY